jgi:ribosomal protein S18 acetylase RimI-like enzyme
MGEMNLNSAAKQSQRRESDIADTTMPNADLRRIRLKNGCSVLMRPVKVDDDQQLIELDGEVFGDGEGIATLPIDYPVGTSQKYGMLTVYCSDPDCLVLLVETAEKAVGFLRCSAADDDFESHLGVVAIEVAPEWRNLGIGRALLGEMLTWAKQNTTIQKLVMSVAASNARAVALFEKMAS